MTREAMLIFVEKFTRKMLETFEKKNKDYAGEETEDPFFNFTRVEAFGIATTEQGILTRMIDKMSRIASITKSGKCNVQEESVKDTLLDLAVYSAILAAYLESRINEHCWDGKISSADIKLPPGGIKAGGTTLHKESLPRHQPVLPQKERYETLHN